MHLLLDRPHAGRRRPRDVLQGHSRHLHHQNDLSFAVRERCQKRFQIIRLNLLRRKRIRLIGQFLQSPLASGGTARPAVVVDAHAARDREDPGQHRFAGAIGVTHPVNAQPGLLQQVIRIATAGRLRHKKPVQPPADVPDQRWHGGTIARLVANHQRIQITA